MCKFTMTIENSSDALTLKSKAPYTDEFDQVIQRVYVHSTIAYTEL